LDENSGKDDGSDAHKKGDEPWAAEKLNIFGKPDRFETVVRKRRQQADQNAAGDADLKLAFRIMAGQRDEYEISHQRRHAGDAGVLRQSERDADRKQIGQVSENRMAGGGQYMPDFRRYEPVPGQFAQTEQNGGGGKRDHRQHERPAQLLQTSHPIHQ